MVDGTTAKVTDKYIRWGNGGWQECADALCGDILEEGVYSHWVKKNKVMEGFKPAFDEGPHSFAKFPGVITGVPFLSREATAGRFIGHEAAHSIGIDMIGDLAATHYQAERMGLKAMHLFRRKYEQ